MTQNELYNRLSDEQKMLFDTLEANDYSVHLYEDEEGICAEIENYTSLGVDMIFCLTPLCFEHLWDIPDIFSVDGLIDEYRQDSQYREKFTIRQSLEDFESWMDDLRTTAKRFRQLYIATEVFKHHIGKHDVVQKVLTTEDCGIVTFFWESGRKIVGEVYCCEYRFDLDFCEVSWKTPNKHGWLVKTTKYYSYDEIEINNI